MNIPNQLTLFRVVLIPFFLIALFMGHGYIAVAIFVIASLTDWLDGFLARRWNLVTNFGKLMDPLADKLLVAAALIAMVELKYLAAWVVIILISREFIVTGFRLVAAGNNIIIAAGSWGKVKTVTQMVMVIFVLLNFKGSAAHLISQILIFASVLFTIISAVEYIYQNRKILKDSK